MTLYQFKNCWVALEMVVSVSKLWNGSVGKYHWAHKLTIGCIGNQSVEAHLVYITAENTDIEAQSEYQKFLDAWREIKPDIKVIDNKQN